MNKVQGLFWVWVFFPTTFLLCYSTAIQTCSNSETVIRSAVIFFQRYGSAEKFPAQQRRVYKNKGTEGISYTRQQKRGEKKRKKKSLTFKLSLSL